MFVLKNVGMLQGATKLGLYLCGRQCRYRVDTNKIQEVTGSSSDSCTDLLGGLN